MRTLAVVLLLAGTAVPVGSAVAKRPVGQSGPLVPAVEPAVVPSPTPGIPLTDRDVERFLTQWPAFASALDELRKTERGPGADPAPGRPQLEQADVAWKADARMQESLAAAGTIPDAFLLLYQRVSSAWWALIQAEDHARADLALERQIRALEEVASKAGKDAAGLEAVREMRRHLDAQGHLAEDPPGNVPRQSVETVRRHRTELAKIFELTGVP